MRDEGLGVRVVERLAKTYAMPEEVMILDGGTLGLDLLYYLEDTTRLILVDVAETGLEPGTVLRLDGDAVPSFLSLKISPHQVGISDMLFTAKLKDIYPPVIKLWGVQPDIIEIGVELSPTLEPLVGTIVQEIVMQLRQWGHTIKRLPDQ